MAELPSHPELLCFSEYIEDFLDKNFQVDEFIGKCRRKVSVECLRQDLDSYYRTLKSSMVELINKDYADFVSLSSNLVSKHGRGGGGVYMGVLYVTTLYPLCCVVKNNLLLYS